MSRKKVGVLTFHRCINYGSYWQARCLVEGLSARGYDAVLLDHDSWSVNVKEWKCGLQPVLPTPVPKRDYFAYTVKMLRFFQAFARLPMSRKFPLDKPRDMERCDTVVVGSDEVWNLQHPWYGGCEVFFGDSLNAQKLVSYAASFGNHSAWCGLEDQWVRRLQAFHEISVRDENSYWMIKNALAREPDVVLDPCLQFKVKREGKWRGPDVPYLAVYGHNFTEPFKQQVRAWAEDRKLKLLSVGYRNDWADIQWMTAGPHDFAHAMSHATAVATNFFHGCVFSLNNSKPFVCEITPYRYIKVKTLMEQVHGAQHLVNEETDSQTYNDLLNEKPDISIFRRIAEMRLSSDAYIARAMA